MVYHSRLGLAMINVSTKFVVVNSIHYEDKKAIQNVENVVVWDTWVTSIWRPGRG